MIGVDPGDMIPRWARGLVRRVTVVRCSIGDSVEVGVQTRRGAWSSAGVHMRYRSGAATIARSAIEAAVVEALAKLGVHPWVRRTRWISRRVGGRGARPAPRWVAYFSPRS